MLLKLFLLFTVLPSVELWLLFQVKEQLGLFETIWLVVVTGIIGASMAKNQGLMVLQELQERSKQGMPPTQTLLEGILVLIGGVLLVTPGIFTDAFGFSLIIPWTRRIWAPLVQSWFSSRFKAQASTVSNGSGPMSSMDYSGSVGQTGGFDVHFTSPSKNESDTIDIQDIQDIHQDNTTSSKNTKGFRHPKF
jgi:UPF0716 protein FxsA